MAHYLKFKNKSTKDFYLTMGKGVSFVSPSKDLEFEKIRGQDGAIAIGDGTLNNIKRDFPFKIEPPASKNVGMVATEMSNWLKEDNLWHELEFSDDPLHVYKAIYVDEYNIEHITGFYGKMVLSFEMKPYKFLKTGLTESVLGTTMTNPTNRPSRPKIIIKGTGNMTLKIGPSTWELKNIDGGIVIDTLLDVVTSITGGVSAWDKIATYPLPTIPPGTHTVTKTGTITEIKIIPRWEVIV
ncbi:hypothetical protein [Jeotgalibaca porci]|uniref:hypothetical protein n=1 Tax=Jeotgalibaca porci TaxID=1868793 RepID=UPI0035A10A84